MDSSFGAGGTDFILSEEDSKKVNASVGEFTVDGETVEATLFEVAGPISGLQAKLVAGSALAVDGKGTKDAEFVAKAPKAEAASASARNPETTSIIRLGNSYNEELSVKAKKGAAIDLKIASGKFRRSSFRGAKGKQDDSVTVGSSAKLINSSFDLRKGDDTFEIKGGATLKKTTTVDLGKGADTVIIGNNIKAKGKSKLVIENMSKNDKLVFGGEEFTKKQIVNGEADLPGFIELG